MPVIRQHNERIRALSLRLWKSCPNCSVKLSFDERAWKWRTYYFCANCFDERIRKKLLDHLATYDCAVCLAHVGVDFLPPWLELKRMREREAGISADRGELMRVWSRNGFRLCLYDLYEGMQPNHWRIGIQLFDRERLVLDWDQLGVPRVHAIDSYHTVAACLRWASRVPETEAEATYSAADLEWLHSERAEELARHADDVMMMEEATTTSNDAANLQRKQWMCSEFIKDADHEWIDCEDCLLKFYSVTTNTRS